MSMTFENKNMKYRIDWMDFSNGYCRYRKMTLNAISISEAFNKFYQKHPKGRNPSVSIIEEKVN